LLSQFCRRFLPRFREPRWRWDPAALRSGHITIATRDMGMAVPLSTGTMTMAYNPMIKGMEILRW